MTLPYSDRPLLLIDDDAQIRLAYSTALRMNGWRHLQSLNRWLLAHA